MRAESSSITRRLFLPVQDIIHDEVNSGSTLLIAAVVALLWANSPWAGTYFSLRETHLVVDFAVLRIDESIGHWINDALMAVFFFVVGLEIKHEFTHGQLSDRRQAVLPIVAAFGGMIVPALFFLLCTRDGAGSRGWGIPMATDIAFALGVLALLGRRIPVEVRVFLLALAIVDDIGAILVIALFYTEHVSYPSLGIAFLLLGAIMVMRRVGVRNVMAYVMVGACLWLATFQSGVHATLAGVALGLLTPAYPLISHDDFLRQAGPLLERLRGYLAANDWAKAEVTLGKMEELTRESEAPLERLQRQVHPWVSFLVLPLFALANAGIALDGETVRGALTSPVTLGVMLGLVAGKVIGIVGACRLALHLRVATLPSVMTHSHLIGVGLLAGMGFTVSIFIAGLAYDDAALVAEAKIGILVASLVAALAGYGFLRGTTKVAPVAATNGQNVREDAAEGT